MAWQSVAKLDDIPVSGLLRTEAGGTEVLILRDGEKLFATSLRCTHENDDLSGGMLEGGNLVCSFHYATFNPSTGEVISAPEDGGDVKPLKTYAVKVDNGEVMVDIR
jgi:nitrite reductase/ring-hydroxylating ferredoxin subunit